MFLFATVCTVLCSLSDACLLGVLRPLSVRVVRSDTARERTAHDRLCILLTFEWSLSAALRALFAYLFCRYDPQSPFRLKLLLNVSLLLSMLACFALRSLLVSSSSSSPSSSLVLFAAWRLVQCAAVGLCDATLGALLFAAYPHLVPLMATVRKAVAVVSPYSCALLVALLTRRRGRRSRSVLGLALIFDALLVVSFCLMCAVIAMSFTLTAAAAGGGGGHSLRARLRETTSKLPAAILLAKRRRQHERQREEQLTAMLDGADETDVAYHTWSAMMKAASAPSMMHGSADLLFVVNALLPPSASDLDLEEEEDDLEEEEGMAVGVGVRRRSRSRRMSTDEYLEERRTAYVQSRVGGAGMKVIVAANALDYVAGGARENMPLLLHHKRQLMYRKFDFASMIPELNNDDDGDDDAIDLKYDHYDCDNGHTTMTMTSATVTETNHSSGVGGVGGGGDCDHSISNGGGGGALSKRMTEKLEAMASWMKQSCGWLRFGLRMACIDRLFLMVSVWNMLSFASLYVALLRLTFWQDAHMIFPAALLSTCLLLFYASGVMVDCLVPWLVGVVAMMRLALLVQLVAAALLLLVTCFEVVQLLLSASALSLPMAVCLLSLGVGLFVHCTDAVVLEPYVSPSSNFAAAPRMVALFALCAKTLVPLMFYVLPCFVVVVVQVPLHSSSQLASPV